MKQTKLESLFEAFINTLFGFCVTYFALPYVNALCGIEMNGKQEFWSIVLFTILSVIRGYIVRRFFNGNLGKYIFNKMKI